MRMKRAFGNMPYTAASLDAKCAIALHAGSPDIALCLIEFVLAGGAAAPLKWRRSTGMYCGNIPKSSTLPRACERYIMSSANVA